MKRFVSIIAAMVLAATALMGADKNQTKNFDYKNFSGIEVSGLVNVDLVKSNAYKVEITLPDTWEPYLKVRVQGDVLKISLENLPVRMTRNIGDTKVEAKIAMPVLKSLEMSGVSQFRCEDVFDMPGAGFKLETEGASRVNKLIVKAKDLDASVEGASHASLEGEFETAEIEMSGASKGTFGLSVGKAVIDLSGAAKPTFRADFDEVAFEVSGASDVNWTGSAIKMKLEASGAAKFRASGSPVNEVRLEASGAAKCDVNAVEYLSINASGAADVHYVAHEGLDIDLISVSRAASVSKTR